MSDEPEKLTDKLAKKIVSEIRSRGMAPGESLSPEAEMCERYGVSRTVLREAISYLSAVDVVETGNGRKPRVAGFNPDVLVAFFSHGLSIKEITSSQIMEARRGFEIEAVRLAALRRTDGDIARLEENLRQTSEALDDQSRFIALDFAFHVIIAEATQNRAFVYLLTALRQSIYDTISTSFTRKNASREWLDKVLEDHKLITRMLAEQKVDASFMAITRHLDQSISAQNIWSIN